LGVHIHPEIVLTLARERQRELEETLKKRYEQVRRTVEVCCEESEARS
jgi:hypothetical protein